MNYSGLKPGIHLYVGPKRIKSISLTDAEEWANLFSLDGSVRTQSVETLFATVAWVHVALTHRANMIDELEVEWTKGDTVDDDPPFRFKTRMELPRIDESLELRSVAYYLKQRAGRRLLGLRWLDPAMVDPDKKSITPTGYGRYFYNSVSGVVPIPADDIIRIYLPGMREADPRPSASQASSLASQLLLGMGETADTFFDTNGLPVIAVIVPEKTLPDDVERTSSMFRRIFQRRRSLDGNKTIGLREGTKIEKISFSPDELAMDGLEKNKIDEILLAHGVPPSLVHKDVNRAEAELKMLQFLGTISSRIEKVADQINEDPDVARLGYRLEVRKERHETVQKWELAKAESIQRLAGRPVMTLNEARERLELDPVPGGDEIYAPPAPGGGPQDQGTSTAFEPQIIEVPEPSTNRIRISTVDPRRAEEFSRLKKFIENGTHREREFKSDILSKAEIAAVVKAEDVDDGNAPFWGIDYP